MVKECAVKGESTQPVRVRPKEVSVRLGSYPGDGEGDRPVEASGTNVRFGRARSGRQRKLDRIVFGGGVCVMRQYSSFAGIVFGQKTRQFFAKLVRLAFASTYDCAHNRARVFHVRHRAIYEAIGEPDSRLRRPPGVPRAL
jgi:hypothetical protein